MATFTPPTDNLLRWGDKTNRGMDRLFSRLAAGPRGRNVFKLNDGTYTENQPGDMTTVAIEYLGGHVHTVSAAEATALTTAGYGSYLT